MKNVVTVTCSEVWIRIVDTNDVGVVYVLFLAILLAAQVIMHGNTW